MPMKKGSGNLDFGDSDDSPDTDAPEPDSGDADRDDVDEPQSPPTTTAETDSTIKSGVDMPTYPYFIRRNKVMDERDERIEVHLRSDIHDQESSFRNELADVLETGEVSKTDAREFALKFAFENPDGVAELMREEGYGATD